MRILLVAEDVPRAARIQMLLEEQSHDVFHAATVSEAFEALEMQRFECVLRDAPPGRELSHEALDRFQNSFQDDGRPRLVVIREDATAAEPFHLARPEEPGVDAVIGGHFSPRRLVELVSEIARAPAPGPVNHAGADLLPVFERESFERQMNYDRGLMAEMVHLFITETNQQIAELQSCVETGNQVQVKRLAHTLKGSFGAVYGRRAAALAREMEEAATRDAASVAGIMLDLRRATAEIQRTLLDLIAE